MEYAHNGLGRDALTQHACGLLPGLQAPPLVQHNSAIDYIIASRKTQQRAGLLGEEITESQATVHEDLVPAFGGPDGFRRRLSDHLPVTVRVRVTNDTDN